MPTSHPPALDPPRVARPRTRWPLVWRVAAYAVLLGCFVGALRPIVTTVDWQDDVSVRYDAVKAWQAGLDPYDPAALSSIGDEVYRTAYIYPPDTLPVAALFNAWDFDVSRTVYLAWQILLLVVTLLIWQRFFLDPGDGSSPWFLLLCLVGFNGTLLIDLRVGNISLFEQAMLWGGLAAWTRGRYALFAILLSLAAACKLTPLAFSILLLLPPARRWVYFAIVWAAMGVRLGLDAVFSPTLFGHFLHAVAGSAGGAAESGHINPCAPELIKALWSHLAASGTEPPALATLPVYVAAIVAILGTSWWAWRAICRRNVPANSAVGTGFRLIGPPDAPDRARDVRLVFLVCLTYTLTVPRMKDYSYILLLPVVWQVAKWTFARNGTAPALLLAACAVMYSEFRGLQAAVDIGWNYLPYFVAVAAWVLLLNESSGASTSTGRAP